MYSNDGRRQDAKSKKVCSVQSAADVCIKAKEITTKGRHRCRKSALNKGSDSRIKKPFFEIERDSVIKNER